MTIDKATVIELRIDAKGRFLFLHSFFVFASSLRASQASKTLLYLDKS